MELKVSTPLHKYESVLILHPETTESEQKSFLKNNQKIIKNHKGEIHSIDSWGKRRLRNPINKLKMGIYLHTTFEAESPTILELERTMKINEKVLRYMHIKLDDRIPLAKHVEEFRSVLAASTLREQEREAKRKAAPGRDRGDRGDRGDRDKGTKPSN